MPTVAELQAQKAAIEKQIADVQREERTAAIARIRSLMAEYGLSLADLSTKGANAKRAGTGAKVPAKYRDPDTGKTWSGRGLQPNWLKAALSSGRSLGEFQI